jgi:hypothetical protein
VNPGEVTDERIIEVLRELKGSAEPTIEEVE